MYLLLLFVEQMYYFFISFEWKFAKIKSAVHNVKHSSQSHVEKDGSILH